MHNLSMAARLRAGAAPIAVVMLVSAVWGRGGSAPPSTQGGGRSPFQVDNGGSAVLPDAASAAAAAAQEYLDAVRNGDYDTAYAALDLTAQARQIMTIQSFRANWEAWARSRGGIAKSTVDKLGCRAWITLVVDMPATRPRALRGSTPSCVETVAEWVREKGNWALASLPFSAYYAKPNRSSPPVALLAIAKRTSTFWSPKDAPAPDLIDPTGLRTALTRLADALVEQDNRAVYDMFSVETRADMSFAEFDHNVRTLQADWLKPVRVHSIGRPEVVAHCILSVKHEPQAEASERAGGNDGSGSAPLVAVPIRLGVHLREGKWRVSAGWR